MGDQGNININVAPLQQLNGCFFFDKLPATEYDELLTAFVACVRELGDQINGLPLRDFSEAVNYHGGVDIQDIPDPSRGTSITILIDDGSKDFLSHKASVKNLPSREISPEKARDILLSVYKDEYTAAFVRNHPDLPIPALPKTLSQLFAATYS